MSSPCRSLCQAMNDRIRARTWSNCAGVFGTWMAIGILPPRQVIVGIQTSNENKMSDGGRGRALLGVKVRKSSQKWSVRRSAVRSIAWLGLCGFIGGRGATIGAQLHNKFFAIIAIAHILSCKLESAFL